MPLAHNSTGLSMKTITLIIGLLLSTFAGISLAQTGAEMPRTPAADGARAYIQFPADGATVSSPFIVRFGLSGIGVAPAGVQLANTGHHHLLVDVTDMPALGLPLPATENVIHFGLGQTETQIDLPPGQHRLQLVLGDWTHTPHDPPIMSEVVTVTVE
jgi:hypothetical protein